MWCSVSLSRRWQCSMSWFNRRSGEVSKAFASEKSECVFLATIPGCTNTLLSSLPALSAGSREFCGPMRTVTSVPKILVLTTSVDALLMVVLGGAGTLIGGAIGAGLVLFLREYLSTLVPWWQYVLGGVYILSILYLPDGVMGLPARIARSGIAVGKP